MESFDFGEVRKADYSVAWKIRKANYTAKSKKFLADGLPKKEDNNNVFRIVNERFGLAGHIIDAARYAHFARQLGQQEHTAELYAHAIKAYKKYADSYLGGYERSDALPIFVANRMASGKRFGAMYSAHHGMPRMELKAQWKKIAAIPYHEYREEAAAMARYYESLLKEDARWVEPDTKAFEKYTTEQKVAYWIYHLRDLDVGQMSDPGRCIVMTKFGHGLSPAQNQKPSAAVELYKLGIAAVPQLIAHLDDNRPTRCKGHWRSYWPEGHYVLRYGDCCQQLFESITEYRIYHGTSYPMQDGAGESCKEQAEYWWQDYRKKHPKRTKP